MNIIPKLHVSHIFMTLHLRTILIFRINIRTLLKYCKNNFRRLLEQC